MGVPSHVAIIMDGNGRWAKSRGLPRTMGHKAGVNALRETVRNACGFEPSEGPLLDYLEAKFGDIYGL